MLLFFYGKKFNKYLHVVIGICFYLCNVKH